MAETGTAIGITITMITAPSLSVALVSHSLASDTLMDTDTAVTIPTVVTTPTLLTTGVATMVGTMGLVTTVVGITAAATTVADITVPLDPLTIATLTVQAMATNRAWRACSSNSLEPGTIEARSMELWDLAPTTPCVLTSTIMAQAAMG